VDGASIAPENIETSTTGTSQGRRDNPVGAVLNRRTTGRFRLFVVPTPQQLSGWSRSGAKRLFDCGCVALALPVLIPILLAIAAGVCFTSPGPVLFLQKRVGRRGCVFTIAKFRTMLHQADVRYHAVSTTENQPFTSVGPFLRRWKLDELPQVFNVLLGHMSLVGPRPKIPEHEKVEVPCRPGITGAATVAFAREEALFERVPSHQLDDFYHSVILPAKRKLDAEYMARATFASDLSLLLNSILRRWDTSPAEQLLDPVADLLAGPRVDPHEAEGSSRAHSRKGAHDEQHSLLVHEPASLRTGTR
jgi:lipopolysaccharide/colanic/teichoic acid biosynthesis glycosyltransferase